MQKLTPRLNAALQYIGDSRVFADIGSDHAYLCSAALESGRAQTAVAGELREGPLKRSRLNGAYLAPRLSFELSDGFDGLKAYDIDTAAICGMGGETIVDILERAGDLTHTALILQPQSFIYKVRQWLWDNGFEIKGETFVTEGRRAYCVMRAEYTGYHRAYDLGELWLGTVRPRNAAFDRFVSCCKTDIKNRLKAGEDAELKMLLAECEMILCKTSAILASASPRRREICELLHLDFEVVPAAHEIDFDLGISRSEAMIRTAKAKALEVASLYPDKLVIGADTMVFAPDGEPLGKPLNDKKAFEMLKALSGKPNTVMTGVCLVKGERVHTFCATSTVNMRAYTDGEINAYIATGEPLDKAGAYALQGIGRCLVDSFDGGLSNIIGLPRQELADAILQFLC